MVCGGVSGSFAARADEAADKFPGYRLAFRDEFDKGDRPDPAVWSYEHGFCRNHEDQYYTEDNAYVRDGNLVIEARRERVPNERYEPGSADWRARREYAEFTSSSIIAKDPYRFNKGIYEVRAKIPVGCGYWPAIWSCGSKYPWPYNGEIDVMEYYGDAIHANVAWGSERPGNPHWNSQAPRMSTFDPDFADKYHVWRMEWTDESIKIYVDDRLLNDINLDQTVNGNPPAAASSIWTTITPTATPSSCTACGSTWPWAAITAASWTRLPSRHATMWITSASTCPKTTNDTQRNAKI